MNESGAAGKNRLEQTPLLDAQLIRARRTELGLSERKLSEKLGAGVSQSVVRGIEAGTNHADLTLGDLRRLAHHLDIPLGRLFTDQTRCTGDAPPTGPATEAQHINDAVGLLASVLQEVGRAVQVSTLAELASLTLDEVDSVLAELDARLSKAGLRLSRVHGDVSIRPANPGPRPTVVREAWRRHFARRSLDLGQARLVYRAYHDDLPRTVGENERLRSASLVNAGLLDRTPSGGFTLSADVGFSLTV